MKPVISLTTDFGHKGPFVAMMKAVMLARCPDANVIDYTHDIPVHWPPEAGFWLSQGFRSFPPGSIHVAVVDPGVGTERKVLLVQAEDHWFVAPDNGLLGPVIDRTAAASVWSVPVDKLVHELELPAPSHTFHGRDVFAPLAGELAAARFEPAILGAVTDDWIPSQIEPPIALGKTVRGSVITVDHFGNLISNIDAALVADLGNPVVELAGHQYELHTTYAKVTPGDYLALVNSLGVIEVARAEGNASKDLGLGRGAPVSVIDRGTP